MKKSHINSGFTLLEIMVSISIIALVLVAVFKVQSSIIRLSFAGEFYSTASILARQKMADIEQKLRNSSSNLNELSSDSLSGDFDPPFSGYKWECLIADFDLKGSEIPENAVQKSQLQQLKKITVEISYKDEYSFTAASWRFIQND